MCSHDNKTVLTAVVCLHDNKATFLQTAVSCVYMILKQYSYKQPWCVYIIIKLLSGLTAVLCVYLIILLAVWCLDDNETTVLTVSCVVFTPW